MNFPELGVRKPVTTLMFFLAVLIIGGVMFSKLSVDFLPEIDNPMVTVVTTWSGSSTEDVETKVTKVIERALGSVNNLKEMTSTTKEGVSTVTCEFIWGTNLDEASNDMRSNLDRIKDDLPDDADEPRLMKFNTSQIPIQFYGVTANESIEHLYDIVDRELCDPIKRLPGVGTVTVFGGYQREIHVFLDPARLTAYGISLSDVAATLAAENVTLPAGNLKVGTLDYTIRVPGEYTDPADLESVVLRAADGRYLYLRDIARVEDGFEEKTALSETNFRDGMRMMVQKRSGANTVSVASAVTAELARIRPTLPRDIDVILLADTSTDIVRSISNVTSTVYWGLLFVVLVTWVFLRSFRSALIIALTIPFSLIAAIIFLYAMGWTINIISMSSLAVAIGMVVDNAVVVLENISKKVDRGVAPREAAMFGAQEVMTAIMASTLTTIVVFLPLVFMTGEAGIMFQQLGGLITATLVASMVCALWLTPMLASKLLLSREARAARSASWALRLKDAGERLFSRADDAYARLLHSALRVRWLVILLALLLLGLGVGLFATIGSEYSPEDDSDRLQIPIELAVGTRVEETLDTCRRALAVALEEAAKDGDIVVSHGVRAGSSGGFGSSEGSHMGQIQLRLVSQKRRHLTAKAIGRATVDRIMQWPEVVKASVSTSGRGPGGNEKPISVEVTGFDLEILQSVADQIAVIVRDTPGAVDVNISREKGRPEIHVAIDRVKAAAHGLNVAQVASSLRTLFYGTTATKFREQDDEYDILLRLDEPHRRTFADLARSEITAADGHRVRLDSVADVVDSIGPLSIQRKNQERMIKVEADVFGRSSGDVVADLRRAVAEHVALPTGVGVHFGGTAEDQATTFGEMRLMIILGLLLVYMVMASQFESLLDPFIIMLAIPFAITGVAAALLLLRLTISIMSLIGMIMLVGVVVNNAIVLVDYTNLLRARGLPLRRAIEDAGRSRLRPVLITTLSTVAGMSPMVFSTGEGSAMWKPMGATIAGGLLFAMLVTLVLVPVLYSLFHARSEKKAPT